MNTYAPPLVSVMIPYYNCEQYIAETIASVEQQTYPHIETIIVDDGSHEESARFLSGLLQNKPHIKSASQNNLGVSAARNRAAGLANGKYFLFLDADDIIMPDYIEKSVEVLENDPACKLVYPMAEFFNAKEGVWHLPPYEGIKSLLTGNRIPVIAIHRSADFAAAGGFDENLPTHEDWDLWIRLLSAEGSVYRIPEILFRYRKRYNGSSLMNKLEHNPALIRADWQRVYAKHSKLFLEHHLGYWDHTQALSQIQTLEELHRQSVADNSALLAQNQKIINDNSILLLKNTETESKCTQTEEALEQALLQVQALQEQSAVLYKKIGELEQSKKQLEQATATISQQNSSLHHRIEHEVKNFSKYKNLWTIKVFKPLVQTEKAISSANRYRKNFRLLAREKGSVSKAYQHLHQMYKNSNLLHIKQFLRTYSGNVPPAPVQLPTPAPYQSRYEVPPVKFIPRTALSLASKEKSVKVICFYLPQFHPFPENDKWWGKGFTEWTNVKPTRPQYEGHYQPHIPHEDIGYYSLLDKETQIKQIEMAKQYGIEGFCYYLYWFSGHRLMETPLDNMLADKDIDFPFCVCWANENWSRRWDGLDTDILIAQDYSPEDDIHFIQHISKYLKDHRYIHVNGKPLLLIYRPNLFPDMKETAQRWRKWCRENGIGEIYLAYPQSFEIKNPAEYDFDAAIEFPPNNSSPPEITETINNKNSDFQGNIYDWRILLERSDNYANPGYTLFRATTPSWDNTARKKNKGIIFENSNPGLFEKYLVNALSDTVIHQKNPDERLVFVNAWNEWAEGAHLEPDEKYGYAWLQAVQNAHLTLQKIQDAPTGVVIHAFYPEILEEILAGLAWSKSFKPLKLYVTAPFYKETEINRILEQSGFDYELLPCENKGRDILPFLKILPSLKRDNIQFFVKIHTKRSLHRTDGDQWRQYLYKQLLSKSGFISAMYSFAENEKLALIAPNNHLATLQNHWGSNKALFQSFCKKTGITYNTEKKNYKFIAGTMFFARTQLFEPMLSLDLNRLHFDDEKGQIDGTLAHVLERYFGVLATESGYLIEEINLPDSNATIKFN